MAEVWSSFQKGVFQLPYSKVREFLLTSAKVAIFSSYSAYYNVAYTLRYMFPYAKSVAYTNVLQRYIRNNLYYYYYRIRYLSHVCASVRSFLPPRASRPQNIGTCIYVRVHRDTGKLLYDYIIIVIFAKNASFRSHGSICLPRIH